MANLQDMNRVLYRHDWRSIDEWVSAFRHLADMSEQEIGDMVGKSPSPMGDDRQILPPMPKG